MLLLVAVLLLTVFGLLAIGVWVGVALISAAILVAFLFAGLPIDKLRGKGRMILHGEQEFVYHRAARIGDVLEGTARISDVYEKDSPSALMEFYVQETSWKDANSGEPVVDVKFTLIVRDTGVKQKGG